MSAKLYIASALTFMLIGCGGSNSGACCSGGIKSGEIAKGEVTFVAGPNGKVENGKVEATVNGDKSKAPTSNAQVVNVQCEGNEGECCAKDNPCTIEFEQKATDCGKEDTTKPNLKLTQEVLDEAKEHYKDLAEGKVVVQGGKVVITETSGQVTSCGLDIEINLPAQWCGREIGSGASTGFAYPFKEGDSVEVLITDADGTERWETATLADGKIILKGLKNVKLPATFTLFRVTAYSDQTLSGVTGVFSGAQ
jgi:hypothetical protein